MSVPSTHMVDTIHGSATHDDVNNIPTNTPYVAGYVSGTNGVEWTPADFARFPGSREVKIYQGFGPLPPIHNFDAIDVESGAVTPAFCAEIVKQRVDAGIIWTTVYGSDSFLAQVTTEIQKLGNHYWNGHVNYWLADWNLNEQEATAKLGSFVHGASCVGVQWASPSSNPNTNLPGTSLTLSQSNCDLSVVDANWIPSGGFTPLPTPAPVPVPPSPVPPQPVAIAGVLVYDQGGTLKSRDVHSSDGGKTWE